jgi:hypothetical protein
LKQDRGGSLVVAEERSARGRGAKFHYSYEKLYEKQERRLNDADKGA